MKRMMINLVCAWTVLVFSWMIYACPSESTLRNDAQDMTIEHVQQSYNNGYGSPQEAEEASLQAQIVKLAAADYSSFLLLWVGTFITIWLVCGGVMMGLAYWWHRKNYPHQASPGL